LRRKVASVAFVTASIGAASLYGHASTTDAHAAVACSPTRQATSAEAERRTRPGEAVQIGDKINLAVFENMVRQEEKWGSQQGAPDLSRSFVQRAELSGERTIQQSGALSLPFLGQIPAEGCTIDELEKAVARSFEQTFRRPAFVTVLAIEHNPIFIAGPVKNPGSYKYSTGMTVLHAVALAGGTGGAQEGWMAVETVREQSRAEQLRAGTTRALARAAVLRGERDGTDAAIPPQLVELVGNSAAAAAVQDQKSLRSLALSMRQARESALRSAVINSASELQAAQMRLPSLDTAIKLRSDRLQTVATLNSSGIATKAQLVDVQAGLVDVEAKKQEALAAIAAAKQKRDQATAELSAFTVEHQAQRELEISAADREVLENRESIETSRGILKAMAPQGEGLVAKQLSLVFEIHRHTANGIQIIPAEETTELIPGDLVRVSPPGNTIRSPVTATSIINVAGK
jgi:polysaccharide biosynthesis/export protein ExoF